MEGRLRSKDMNIMGSPRKEKDLKSVLGSPRKEKENPASPTPKRKREKAETKDAPPAKHSNKRRDKKDGSQRLLAAQELVKTEQSYVNHLNLLITHFEVPLIKGEAKHFHIEESDLRLLFSNIDVIYQFNLTLLQELEVRLKSWETPNSEQLLGDIFKKMGPFLAMYNDYVSNFGGAVNLLTKLKQQDPEFHKWLKDTALKINFDFLDLLITPVQRIPRYRLLLEAMLRCTTIDHPDYELLSEALQIINLAAERLNEHVRIFESLNKVITIAGKIRGNNDPDNDLIQPHRRFVSQHDLYLIGWDETTTEASTSEMSLEPSAALPLPSTADKLATCFVFTDIFVVTLPRQDGLLDWVDSMTLWDSFLKASIKADDSPLMFQYVHPKHTFILRASSEVEKKRFSESIQAARTALIQADPVLGDKRRKVKLSRNEWTCQWEALADPPQFTVRISLDQLEKETAEETKRALEELLTNQETVDKLGTPSKLNTPSKKTKLDGLKEKMARFSPSRSKKTKRETTLSSPCQIRSSGNLNYSAMHEAEKDAKDILQMEIQRWTDTSTNLKYKKPATSENMKKWRNPDHQSKEDGASKTASETCTFSDFSATDKSEKSLGLTERTLSVSASYESVAQEK